jgi:DNA-binding transcriptional LysR family regulator
MWLLKTKLLRWLYWSHMFKGGAFDIPHRARGWWHAEGTSAIRLRGVHEEADSSAHRRKNEPMTTIEAKSSPVCRLHLAQERAFPAARGPAIRTPNRIGSAAPKRAKHVTLEQLRVFVAVAERQHVTRAAAALNVAQSAVSAAIAALEARHGAKLFDRVGRGVELTEAGALFLVEARAVLARVEAAGLVLSELGNLKRGTLAVHASQTIASYWLPRHLVAFRHKYPGIDIRLTVGNTAQVAAAVHEGVADLGFIEGMIEDPMLTKEQVARDQLVIVVGTEHAWSAIDRLEPDRLLETDWVLREPGSGTRSTFEAALQGFGVSPGASRIALELPSNEVVRAAVEAGLGATAISASVAAPSLEAGLLHRVRFNLPERDFQVVRHVARRRNRAADALLSMVTAPFARSSRAP